MTYYFHTMHYIASYFNELIALTNEMAPYLLFGFLFAGILKVYFPKRLLVKFMGQSNNMSALNASLLGVPMPLCSCGVLPTGISLFRNGASRGSTNSFLISTPQTGVDSILVTYSMLGMPFAIIRPIIALITGFVGGVLTNLFVRENKQEEPINQPIEENGPRTFSFMMRFAFIEFLQDISKWLIIGLLAAAFLATLLPDDFFSLYVSNPYLSMLIVLLASIPLYVCATASVPIAAVLLMKGLAPGAVLVFLMAGPATNAASLTVIGKVLGKKTTLIYLFTIVASALLFGSLIQLLPADWFKIDHQHLHHQHNEILPNWLKTGSSITLTLLVINGYIQKYFYNTKSTLMNTQNDMRHTMKIKVGGMTCNHCTNNVVTNLKKIENIEDAVANLQTQSVEIRGENIDLETIKSTIEGLGYTFEGKVNV